MLLVYAGLLPLALSLILLLIPRRRAREVCAVAFTLLTSGAVAYLLFRGGDAGVEGFRLMADRLAMAPEDAGQGVSLPNPFVFSLGLDGAGRVYLGLAALLWPLSTLYAVEYMRHEQRAGHFYSWYLCSYSAVIFLAAAKNLFTLYIFYELLTLCTVPLVWHKRDEESTKAALVYMLYLFGGAALGLIAAVGFGVYYGTGDFAQGHLTLISNSGPACWMALLGFVGFGVKAAVLPLCRWLPKASVAPTPVTALLHAVAVVNAGVYAVMRLLYFAAPYVQTLQPVMLLLSAATLLYAAVMAVREQQVKRRLAWSTVSNLSYMLFGLSLLSEQGMTAGLAHMIFHSLAKIILFFCAGSILTQTGRTQVRQMHGLGRKMPFTFACFTLAGLSLTGVPPLAGFVSKYALVTAAFQAGGALPLIGAVALMLSTVLTVIYIFTVVFPAFFMKYHEEPGETPPRDPGWRMKLSLAALCALLLAASLFAGNIMAWLQALGRSVIA